MRVFSIVTIAILIASTASASREKYAKARCGRNEVFSLKGPADFCEARCANPTNYGIECTETSPKCVCLPGYVRIGFTNRQCVKIEECGDIGRDYTWSNCSANEVKTNCGSFGFCEKNCANLHAEGIQCPKVCVNTCRCQDGFVRASETDKTCVPVDSCNENEQRFVGGCRITDALSKTCPKDPQCPKGFDVKREGKGCCCEETIAPVELKTCQINEKFVNIAPASFCEGRCANPNNVGIDCPPPHGSACVCAPGFIRHCQTNRTCVRSDECGKKDRDYLSSPCKLNEIFNECGKPDFCDGTCYNPDAEGVKCPEACVKRCECKEGFVRANYNTDMTCVARDTCPAPPENLAGFCTFTNALDNCCPEHPECPKGYKLKRKGIGCCCEEFITPEDIKSCPLNEVVAFPAPAEFCDGRCANPNSVGIDCPPAHGARCVCAKGFTRVCQTNRTCVRLEDCGNKDRDYLSKPCLLNEVLNECGRPDFCDGTCDNPNADGVKCPNVCVKRCECKPGFVRAKYNSDMTCVPQNSCPKPKKELAGFCTITDALKGRCPKYAECPKGYQLRRKGHGCCCEEFTIPEKLKCPKNEVVALPAPADYCEGRCSNPFSTGIDCPPPHGAKCICAPGFIRVCQSNRTCIRAEDCGNKDRDYIFAPCLLNESFNECGRPDFCDGTCDNPNADGVKCPNVCVKRCECKPGFVRAKYNSDMTCVPQHSCPKPDKVLAGFCTFTDAINKRCPKNAECPAGYQMRHKGHGCCCEEFTIPERIVSCPKNEIVAFPAPAEYCEGRCANPNNAGIDCPPPHGERCVCAPGFIRHCQSNRTCVRPEDCGDKARDYVFKPVPCSANEELTKCGTLDYCDATCANPNAEGIKCPRVCVERCSCKEGFVRASYTDKTCVPLDSCPKPEPIYAGFCTFTDALKTCCPKNAECPEGYQLKRTKESCCCEEFTIPEKLHCPKNEVASYLAPAEFCEGRCANPNNVGIDCPPPHGSRCICAPGFTRVCQTNRTCIRLEDCGKKEPDYVIKTNLCSANEVYNDCGNFNYCDATCANPNAEGIKCPQACVKRCDCKEGYVRASYTDHTCVKLDTCPKPDDCLAGFCTVTDAIEGECPKNPHCPKGYQLKREGNGCCCEEFTIPERLHCPKNEVASYIAPAEFCEGRCANPTNVGIDCPPPHGARCLCEPGFIRVCQTNRTCVRIEDCGKKPQDYLFKPNPCGDDEVYNECGKLDYCDGTCDNPNSKGVKCPDACVKRCECKPGFVRAKYNSDMTCVPLHSCPKPKNNLAGFCTITDSLKGRCPKYAECPKGYQLRRKDGGCCCEEFTIPERLNCPKNEVASYFAPAEFCEGRCANPNNTGIDCPPPHGARCLCAPGFIRVCQTNRTCIRIEDCGKKPQDYLFKPNPCGADEVYNECGKLDYCDGTCDNPDAKGVKCPDVCVKRCDCKPGFVRAKYNSDMTCVPKHSCPKPKSNLAGFCTFTNALDNCCPEHPVCPKGYQLKRKGDGCCCEEFTIPERLKCEGKNEVASYLAPSEACEGRCANPLNVGIDCPPPHGARCICAPGFTRVCQTNRTCIRLEDCGKKPQDYFFKQNPCSADEVFNECGRPDFCDGTCDNPEAEGIKCPNVCVKRCECKEGFVRSKYNSNMTCVPKKSCPKPPRNIAGFCTITDALNKRCPRHAECPKGYQLRHKGQGCCCEEFTIPERLHCPKNEVASYIAPAEFCEGRCANPTNVGIDCPPPHGARCLCEPGFIRVCQTNRTCVRIEECGKKPQDYLFKQNPCGSEKVFNECGKLDYCDGTCANPEAKGVKCPDVCVKRCECKPGFVRAKYNSDMTCVPLDSCPIPERRFAGFCIFSNSLKQCCPINAECPKGYLLKKVGSGCCCEEFTLSYEPAKCSKYEIFSRPIPADFCEATCANPKNTGINCPPPHGPGCICKSGYVRASIADKSCVELKKCRKIEGDDLNSCSAYEVPTECGKYDFCDGTCGNPNSVGFTCTKGCVSRCRCKDGYVRLNRFDKRCIPIGFCSNKAITDIEWSGEVEE